MEKIRVCLWATTLQANIWSLAKYLSQDEKFEIVVVTEGAERWRSEPITTVFPPMFEVLDKNASETLRFLKNEFHPQVTVVDNHYPPSKLSPFLINVWHGFGWKGPEDRAAFNTVFKNVKKLTGISPERPNPYFRFISAGETNRDYRIHVTEFAPENVLPLGQAFTDDIVRNDIKRQEIEKFYSESFIGHKICLFAPTWHFGRIFSHLGDDIEILGRIFDTLERLECALILRMHDRNRFDPAYLHALQSLVSRHPLVMMKYKDMDRDNLLDISVSDVMMSNYSSILTFFYGTSRPSIHIYPVDKRREASYYRVWKNGAVQLKKAPEDSYIWSLPPEENGGLVAASVEEIEAALEQALTDPSCCVEKSRRFIENHTAPYDGRVCENIAGEIIDMVETTPAAKPKRFPWL